MPFFEGNLFALVVICTYPFNSPRSLISSNELLAFQSSKFTYIVLQSGLHLISKWLTVLIELLTNLSDSQILSVNIILAPTYNFNFAVTLAVSEIPIIRYRYKLVFVSVSLLLSCSLTTATSESCLTVQCCLVVINSTVLLSSY